MVALSVVVPTRNEEENVRLLVERTRASLDGVDFEVIFVDDSTDQTPQIIEGLMAEHSNIRLLHRRGEEREGGLATAVACGFQLARGDYICVIDGDLQHPPELISQLSEEAKASRADIVVASRYRRGGSYDGLAGPLRKLLSVALKGFARLVFFPRLNGITDPLSGFFLVRRGIIQDVVLTPVGFKVLLEVLVHCPWKTVREVPYRFVSRESGESKATVKQGMVFLLHIIKLLLAPSSGGRPLKFALVGGTVALLGIGILYMLVDVLSVEKNAAYFVQAVISLQINFVLNNQFTWADRRGQSRSLWNRWVRFHGARGLAFVLNQLLFALLTALGVHYLVACIFGIAVATGLNYFTSDRFVFSAAE